jgi:hypothetical protein
MERHVRDKRLQTVTNNGIKLLKDAFRVSSCQVMDPEIDPQNKIEEEAHRPIFVKRTCWPWQRGCWFQEQIQFRHGRLPGQEYLDPL